jgi:hypothetical protein
MSHGLAPWLIYRLIGAILLFVKFQDERSCVNGRALVLFLTISAFLCVFFFGGNASATGILEDDRPDSTEQRKGIGGQSFSFNLVLSENKCQIAVWIEDADGNYVDTAYVTRMTAKRGLGNRAGDIDARWSGGARLSTLPVWAFHRGHDYGGGNYYPTKEKPLPDALTSATPKAGFFSWVWRPLYPLPNGKYYFFVEVNKSFDQNEHHDYSWYRGQPSVVWRGEITVGPTHATAEAMIIGHGDPQGENGNIYPDVTTLTTALKLIHRAEVVFEPSVEAN